MSVPETQCPHPLIKRLLDLDYPLLDAGGVDAFINPTGVSVLFFTGDMDRVAESADVAVILPELRTACGGAFRAGVVSYADENTLKSRFGVMVLPSLVFHRDGAYLGVIGGVRDWDAYLERFAELMKAPASRAPGIGIAVRGESPSSACH